MENRPLSPHIQIYKWHISSLVSISHRITGIINFFAITLICIWFALMLLGESNYQIIKIFLETFLGKFILILFIFFINIFLGGFLTLIPSLAYLYIGLPLCLRAE